MGIALLILIGCSRSDEKQTIKTPEGTVELDGQSMKIHTKDGTATIEQKGDTMRVESKEGSMVVGAGELPAGFPIPIYAGAKVENHTHITQPGGQEVFQATITSSASPQDVAAFYEKFFTDKGVSVSRTEQSTGESKMVMLGGSSDDADAYAMVMREQPAEPTTATVSWNVKKK
jgi:hypothetical protein